MRGALTACGVVCVLIEVVVPIQDWLDDDDLELPHPLILLNSITDK